MQHLVFQNCLEFIQRDRANESRVEIKCQATPLETDAHSVDCIVLNQPPLSQNPGMKWLFSGKPISSQLNPSFYL
jgi:hypothetical protein